MKYSIRYLMAPLALSLGLPALGGDLIAWWNFDTLGSGIAVDAQAGNVGVLLNGAQFSNPGTGRSGGAADRAMLFGNDRHRMHVVDASFLNAAGAANAISISFWQNLTAVRNQTTLFANSATLQRAFGAHTPWSDSTIYWDTGGCCGPDQRVSVNPGANWLSTWNHIVLVKSGDTKIIYVNGVEALNGTNAAPLPTDFTELFIGNSSNQGEAVDGWLDDVAIFKRELTPAEVASLAGGASPASIDPSNDADADGLPDAWELRFAADLTVLAPAGDNDSDGLKNDLELAQGTKPNDNDTDDDGALDGVETKTGTWVSASDTGTNPLLPDTDGDTLKDGGETNTGTYVNALNAGTNPHVSDTDGDGFADGVEANYGGSNPTNSLSRPLRSGQLDILAYWPFNDASDATKAVDAVRGFTGTLRVGNDGTPTAYSPDGGGRTGAAGDRAMDFGTTGQNATGVDVAAGGLLNIASAQNQVAISFWQKLYSVVDSTSFKGASPSSSGGERGLSGHATWSNNNYYWDTAGCCDGGTQRINGPNDVNLVDEWHHLVFQKNGNVKEVWVDGVLKVSGNNTAPLPTDFRSLQIGRDLANENIAGLIDDFAVYADALTPEQIQLLATGTAPNSPTLVPPSTDTDGDGMQDAYEIANGLNPNVDDRFGDLDSDGVNNLTENLNGTKPNNPDTDGDTLSDGVETKTGVWVSATNTGTDPLKPDSDGDGLADASETNTGVYVSATNTGTNPNKGDTDGDKWSDLTELQWPSDPNAKTSVPALDPGKLDLLAYWDFNNASSPSQAVDSQHGWVAKFFGAGTRFSDPGQGQSGGQADRALDLGTAGGSNGADVPNAGWFGLGVPKAKYTANLGSLGSAGDLFMGGGLFGAPSALAAGGADTAVTVPSVLNTRAPYDPALNPTGAWTAEAWLKPAAANAPGTLTCALACGDFAAPRKGWLIYQSDTGWNLRTYYSDGLATAVNMTGNNGAPPAPDTWTHLVASWDGTKARLYVDGVLRVTSDPKPYVAGLGGGFHVGSRSDASFPWNGDADEVAFYNTALSEDVVLAHYNNGKAAAPAQPYQSLVLASNPVAFWRMTDSSPGEVPPDQVAVSFWQRLSEVSASSAFWASSPSSSANQRGYQAHVSWSDGNIYFDSAGCCDPPQRISGPGDIVVDQWQHFVFQKTGGRKEVWRDGVMILSGDGAAILPQDFTRLTIGAEPSGAGGINATRGLIDEFAVFGESLTEAQIARLAAGESPTSLVTAPPASIAFTSVSYNPATSQLTLTWTSQPGKTYNLKTSQTLATWPVELNDNIASGGTSTTYVHTITTFPGGAPPALYYRVSQNP